ncbi:phosphatidylserine synthase I [Cryptosporidium sp. chipmunk genotype I]|uniref:phosphatidylserine synthase I n=1 Tax=Cryptosporidium sp. chipmunk genotype I TaxID=1280935 RepID=UPI00351A4A16|nr:phosphatidylserine synthase I [Cryptosporidium sp. chipmunk genotype I]
MNIVGKKWIPEVGEHHSSRSTGYMSFWTSILLSMPVITLWIFSELLSRRLLAESLRISPNTRITWGVVAVIGITMVMSVHFLPRGAFRWPCYAFWKIMMGMNILYFMLLTFLMFQDEEYIRNALVYIDPKLIERVPEVNYAGNSCSIIDESNGWFSNILPKIDVFVIAHFLGWLVKALILRNDFLVWFNSILFEWLEITLRHILPNFYECWWDHILLDIFGCNMIGIFCGNYIIKKFKMIRFNWHTCRNGFGGQEYKNKTGNSSSNSKKGAKASKESGSNFEDKQNQEPKSELGLLRVKNFICSLFKWPETLSTLRGFASFLILTAIVQLIDLNYFFFKAEFYMPVSHWIFAVRTALLAICGASAVRELYETIARDSSIHFAKISFQCWLIVVVIFTESLLCWRFSGNLRVESFIPSNFIIYIWIFIFFILIVLYLFLTLQSFFQNLGSNRKKNE